MKNKIMTDEKRKIADIVEAFGKINQDIYNSFRVMSNLIKKNIMEKKGYEILKKSEKKQYFDFKQLLYGNGGWYYLNYYGKMDGKVVGFTFVIGIGDCEDYENYEKFIAALDPSLNKQTPMLCIYGIYEPIATDKILLVDKSGWNYVDEIIGINGWEAKFNLDDLSYEKWLNIEIDYTVYENYEGWYKKAQVKIIQIADINSEEVAEKIIDDLFKKTKY